MEGSPLEEFLRYQQQMLFRLKSLQQTRILEVGAENLTAEHYHIMNLEQQQFRKELKLISELIMDKAHRSYGKFSIQKGKKKKFPLDNYIKKIE